MKTKPFAVRLPIALAIALERQAEKESLTAADVIRSTLANSFAGHKEQLLELLQAVEIQLKGLRLGQEQILQKLSEFDVDVVGEQE